MSGMFEYLFSKRERTKNRSDNLFKNITMFSPIYSVFFNATTSLSARREIVRQICNNAEPLLPPGRIKFLSSSN